LSDGEKGKIGFATPSPSFLMMIHNWMRMLLAILAGNLIYFLAEPILPGFLAHDLYKLDPGLILDFAICAGIYLLLRKKAA
jgi:hypothetical protein